MARNRSDLIWGISAQPALQRRVEALVREYWWNNPEGTPEAAIPMSGLLWAIASDPGVQSTVSSQMDNEEPGSLAAGSYDGGIGAVDDSDLERILFSGGALERLVNP